MNAEMLKLIFTAGLLPFIQEKFPDGHKLFQDQDPKHASSAIEEFFERHNVEWWPSPPESPDLNPIDNVWGSMKQYLRTAYKPMNLEELRAGIERFWITLTPDVCKQYIGHLQKVMPKIVELQGEPSGY